MKERKLICFQLLAFCVKLKLEDPVQRRRKQKNDEQNKSKANWITVITVKLDYWKQSRPENSIPMESSPTKPHSFCPINEA